MKSTDYDTVVLGAGAAGLAAAVELAQADHAVCLLEARDRIGGRICTLRDAAFPLPVELGAEFIHGRPEATLSWLRQAQAPIVDVPAAHWMVQRGALAPAGQVFAELKRALAKVRRPRRDLPFSKLLASPALAGLSRPARTLAHMLAEGFDAADTTRASALEMLEEWTGEGAADAPTFRPLGGYGALIDALAPREGCDLRLSAVVEEVCWRPGHVRVAGSGPAGAFEVEARQVVIALPLGVLQAPAGAPAAVRFDPPLESKTEALTAVVAGPVVKVVFAFRAAFWEELERQRYCDGCFFHAPAAPFPTFWTTLPLRTSVLTGWSAGPKGAALSGASRQRILDTALASLQVLFGKRRSSLRRELEAWYAHDWAADPYARGAYSYLAVGAARARETLAKPLGGTLFFAGEAVDRRGEAGTVAGALQSGKRAARQALRSRARRVVPSR